MEKVWEEIEENIQVAVEAVQDDRDVGIIRQQEDNLRSFEGEWIDWHIMVQQVMELYYFSRPL